MSYSSTSPIVRFLVKGQWFDLSPPPLPWWFEQVIFLLTVKNRIEQILKNKNSAIKKIRPLSYYLIYGGLVLTIIEFMTGPWKKIEREIKYHLWRWVGKRKWDSVLTLPIPALFWTGYQTGPLFIVQIKLF